MAPSHYLPSKIKCITVDIDGIPITFQTTDGKVSGKAIAEARKFMQQIREVRRR